jgi:serine phosphatase RsbU (regulator of sigma subunit)
VLAWLNDALHAGNRGLFATVAYLTLEPNGDGTWQITTTSAGHPFPVIVRADGTARMVGSPGMLVGAVPSITVTPVEGRLERGDTLVLYTDGVTDVSPPHGLDPDALEKLVARACERETDAEDIAVGLGREIEEVLPISERNDDVALVIVHVI